MAGPQCGLEQGRRCPLSMYPALCTLPPPQPLARPSRDTPAKEGRKGYRERRAENRMPSLKCKRQWEGIFLRSSTAHGRAHAAALSREFGYMGAGWAAREGSYCQRPHLLRKWPPTGLGPREASRLGCAQKHFSFTAIRLSGWNMH